MSHETEAIITPGTSLVYPYYNGVGKLCAVLLKDGELVCVKHSPTEVVDLSMKYFGTSLRGGVDGGKSLLGEVHMMPVMINESLDMYMFPSKSPSSDRCVWFSLTHILTFLPFDKDHTQVILRDGTVFNIDCSYPVFHSRYQRTCMLKTGLTTRVLQMKLKEKGNSKPYLIRRKGKHGNFEISED